jgi:hypothetical protein
MGHKIRERIGEWELAMVIMANRRQLWWWRSKASGQVAVTPFAAVMAGYLARLLMLYFP